MPSKFVDEDSELLEQPTTAIRYYPKIADVKAPISLVVSEQRLGYSYAPNGLLLYWRKDTDAV